MTSASLCAKLQNIDIEVPALEFEISAPQDRVLAYIEHSLGFCIQAIQTRPDGCPSIALKRIRDVQTSINAVTQRVERQIVDREVTYSFPGKNKDEAWRFGRWQIMSTSNIT